MPFDRPTLGELVTRIRADLKSRLAITGAILRRATAKILAVVWAGAVHLLHGHLEWLSKQLFADTAEEEFLLRQAGMHGIAKTAATFASGTVLATGTDTSIILVDTILVRDDGVTYRVTVEAEIGSSVPGEVSVSIEAVEAGADGNMDDVSETLDFESPIAGVDSSVAVEAPGITGGNNEESTEALRTRFLLYKREPPAGGRDADYEAWSLAVAGVTRAWVYPNENGLGTVVVRFVRDDDVSIFPDAGEVTAVQDALDEQRPITAEVTAEAPVQLDVDFTITLTPDTSATRAAVEAELADLLRRVAEPGDGAGRGTVLLSQIQTAIGVAEGVTDFTLTVPAADVVPALGELCVPGAFTWV